MSPEALDWLVDGEHGLSSEALFHKIVLGREPQDRYPLDVDDFRRCELLLRQVPGLRERLPEMAEVGPEWNEIVKVWQLVADTAERELPGVFSRERFHGRCEQAYAVLDAAIEAGRSARKAAHS